MGARSGGSGAGFGVGVSGRDFSKIPGLQAVTDPQVRKELIQTLVDYDKEFGVKQTNITLQDLGIRVLGEAQLYHAKTENAIYYLEDFS